VNPSPPHKPATTGLDPTTRVVVLLGGCILAAAGLIWLSGQIAGLLFGGGWPATPPSGMLGILVDLRGNLDDPALAWPRRSRSLVPGPLAFYGTLVGLLSMGFGVAWLAAGVWTRRRAPRQRDTTAAWATERDLKPLLVNHPTPGRITLGRTGRHLLAAEPKQAVIVLGPARSGKTTGLAIPAILGWDGPVIATSVRNDLVADTIVDRRARGRTWVYDPTGKAVNASRAGWSPLDGCTTWTGALRTASWLAEAGREADVTDGDFWRANAAKLLAPLLFAAATSGATVADVLRWIDLQEELEVRFALEAAAEPAALFAAEASWAREDRTKSSVYTTAETLLRAFADPDVLASTYSSDITPDALLDGGVNTLYVCAPSHEQARLRPLFAALLQQVITAAYDRAAAGQTLQRPLLLLLDEAANIAPLADLDTIASTAAGTGIQLVTIWQDMAQIHARYRERAATVVNNHRAKLALSGISDSRTLEYLSRLAGEAELIRHSTTRDPSAGRTTTTENTQMRRLAADDQLRRIRPGGGLLLYGHLPPARLTLGAAPGVQPGGLNGRSVRSPAM